MSTIAIEGFMVNGDEIHNATISWAAPVDEPPVVTLRDGRALYLETWRRKGWEWRDAPAVGSQSEETS